ncbi:hypothetical protein [Cognatiyoonia sp. IB215182]|uniref:hypothetical protein n=1 Tax=Cognatiyoonia sp. IB215182 TaxID=3097353 RepID=UPI002A0F9E04|nr:hypothetical protein [Cognatiyoonia sp. IB215182]MDX8353984.1 hypothetical protein [Cognatiyoonia sp. IB215182]
MLLYQSFPRRSLNAQPDDALHAALFQLGFVAGYGLLLTPEPLVIPANPRATANVGAAETSFTQCRACFTLIEREELWAPGSAKTGRSAGKSHAELFGAFAIGLDPVDARLFGLTPVSYYYSGVEDANRTYEMLFRLREFHELFTILAVLEARVGVPDAVDINTLHDRGLLPSHGADAISRITQADPSLLQAFVDLVRTDRPAAWRMADNLEMLMDAMQTADSATSVGSLAYYEQREWRITRGYGAHLNVVPLGPARKGDPAIPSETEADRLDLRRALHGSDQSYFKEAILDDCVVLVGPRGGHFFEYVKEVVTPSGAAAYRVGAWLDEVFPGAFREASCNGGRNKVFVRAVV